MWLVCLNMRGRRPPTGPSIIAGYQSEWQRVRIEGDVTPHMGAHVPDEEAAASEARLMAPHMHGHVAVDDDDIIVCAAEHAAAPAPKRDVIADLTAIAIRNGWSVEDLVGAGQDGEPGELGGRGRRSGLTLAEMTLTGPPVDWNVDIAPKGRPPWESADWTPPSVGWQAPSWPDPPAESKPDPTAPTGDKTPTVVEPPTPAAAPDAAPPDPPPADPTDAPAAGGISNLDAEPPAANGSSSETYGYPADRYDEVKAITVDLFQQKGRAPHPNAVGFLTKKMDPPAPTPNSEQIAGMLSHLTS